MRLSTYPLGLGLGLGQGLWLGLGLKLWELGLGLGLRLARLLNLFDRCYILGASPVKASLELLRLLHVRALNLSGGANAGARAVVQTGAGPGAVAEAG